MSKLGEMYITLMPLIMAGVLNMAFTKTAFFKKNNPPIDGGRCLGDGKRIFGDNKTRKGFWGMTVICGMTQVLWGLISLAEPSLAARNRVYEAVGNTVLINLGVGLLFGFTYALFELPNSFIKRRFDITPGKTGSGIIGAAFFIIDQIDSLLGVTLCLALICHMSFAEYWLYILVGGATHLVLNISLYALSLKRNI
ncbi:MAG: CDP-archaeol synthase [Ruminococcus sp.]|nr:CDP-archaeol synthase [Ruminococcus sp.]